MTVNSPSETGLRRRRALAETELPYQCMSESHPATQEEEGEVQRGHDDSPFVLERGRVGLELIFLGVVWVVTAGLLWHGLSLDIWRDETIGAGAYPVFALIGLLAITSVLIAKALAVRELTLYAPFQPGLQEDLRLRQIAVFMARKLGIRISVVTKDGEGRFSALWKGLRAGQRGDALTVVTSDMTSLPNFHAAAFCQGRMEPVGGLFFDPDVLLVRHDSSWKKPVDLQHEDRPVRLGFGHHQDVHHAVDTWLAHTQGLVFQPSYSADVPSLLAALRRGEIDATVLCYSQARLAISSGQVRCIGIFSEPQWKPAGTEEFTTVSECGTRIVSGHWAALMVPADMASRKKTRLAMAFAEANDALVLPDDSDMSARPWCFLSREDMKGIVDTQQHCFQQIGFEKGARDSRTEGKTVGLVVAIAGLAIFPVAMLELGFVVSAFLYIATLTLLLWPKLTPAKAALSVAVSAFLSIGSYLLFNKVFSVVLPTSNLLGGLLP
ncbi:tripartite tricarboxylate transporter TctB family protein [Fodinicurvata sediminis]|uniref:tripartite tricarboxylate transporter TctB family protein n=1 Tax=Fodinicurvata sediminis TaxID=1121832 RepID=UPI0003B496A0|nr:tripartite tricarboxylate transporter TctB family protein [Fodinicurvata sediminis]